MFSQLFGKYLIESDIISEEQYAISSFALSFFVVCNAYG